MYPVYTIGHGSRKAEVFLDLLQRYGIRFLIDVRSTPFSRFHPQYNRLALREMLEKNKIRYVYLGYELGGRPKDRQFYDEAGKVDYTAIRSTPAFREGIERLKKAAALEVPVALMCSERAPADCHRARLIAPELEKEQIPVQHINEKGELETQQSVMGKDC